MEIATIKEVLMKPIGPTVGFVSQFLVMPLVSFESYKLCIGFCFQTAVLSLIGGNCLRCWIDVVAVTLSTYVRSSADYNSFICHLNVK